jgi:Zn-dependent protease with chaperone function
MPLVLLLLLTVVIMPIKWPGPPYWVQSLGHQVLEKLGLSTPAWGASLAGSILLTWLGVALIVGSAALLAQWTRWRLTRDPAQRDHFLHRHSSWRFYHLIGMFTVYGLALYVLGWGWVAQGGPYQDAAGSEPLPGSELLVLIPLLTALVLTWICFYDADRALHYAAPGSDHRPPYWSRKAYLAFRVRQNLALVAIPIILLLIVRNLPSLLVEGGGLDVTLAVAVTIFMALVVFACIPSIFRLVLHLQPMPEGLLRSRLLAASRRLRVRCSNILIWNTRGGVANALVIGILPMLRYVVLTDRLVAEMTPDEVEAVFGHEAGHVKHRHMLYYLGFMMVSLMVLAGLSVAIGFDEWWGHTTRQYLMALPLVGLLGAYIFFVFGFVCRRCERQADVYGCRAVSCVRSDCAGHDHEVELSPGGRGLCPTGIRTFIGALEKVARLNGISRDRPGWLHSWQHSTIARRVEFLTQVLADPGVESRFQRTVALVKWSMLLGLVALLLLTGKGSFTAP